MNQIHTYHRICAQSICRKPFKTTTQNRILCRNCLVEGAYAAEVLRGQQDPDPMVAVEEIKSVYNPFNNMVDLTVARIKELLHVKGGEYALDTDRLANFRINGEHMGLPMETVWRVYAGKHWDAINTYIRDLRDGKTRPRSEAIEGRIDDLMTYCLLLKAIIAEQGKTIGE